MKTILETTLEDPEEAVILQQLLNEMGYKTPVTRDSTPTTGESTS